MSGKSDKGDECCVMTSKTCLCVRVSSCSRARSCACSAAIVCSSCSFVLNWARSAVISSSCSLDLTILGRDDRGAGVTSGIPVKVSCVDDDDSKFVDDDDSKFVDNDDSKLLLTMLCSVACSVFSMFMFLFLLL